MNTNLSKRQRKQLRELARLAYERELSVATQGLFQDFVRWESKEMDVFELNEKIHEFHHTISRDLYRRYTDMDADFCVASAFLRGVLSRNEIEDHVFVTIERMVLALSPDFG